MFCGVKLVSLSAHLVMKSYLFGNSSQQMTRLLFPSDFRISCKARPEPMQSPSGLWWVRMTASLQFLINSHASLKSISIFNTSLNFLEHFVYFSAVGD